MSRDFIAELQTEIKKRHLLTHPFYQLWKHGQLPLTVMRYYAEQYWRLERSFPTFLSRLHSHCPDFAARQQITDNLYSEEHGKENHLALWKQFAARIGVAVDSLAASPLLPETQATLRCFRRLTTFFLPGVGALAVYEAQSAEVATVKAEWLQKYYGITETDALRFFVVHGTLDHDHASVWWQILHQHVKNKKQHHAVLAAVRAARDALWEFLSGLCRAYLPAALPR